MIRSIFVNPDGSSCGVYTDNLMSLYEECEAVIERASNVEYESGSRMWVARADDGSILAKHRIRQVAIEMEVNELERRERERKRELNLFAIVPSSPGLLLEAV